MADKPLYWDAPYEIVLALKAAHAHTDIDSLGRQDLLNLIIRLPNFADDPTLANDGILDDILREWYEESGNGWN